MKETDLAKKVVTWLEAQHWDVYQEVTVTGHGGIADIVAVRDGKLWIIECKTSLTFTVLEQASHWRAHYRSIAIPRPKTKSRSIAYHIANKHLDLGVLEVGEQINVIHQPPLKRDFHKSAKYFMSQLKEEHKHYSPAGSNNGGYYTPYRATMDRVKNYISAHPGCTFKEIMYDLGKNHHYSSDNTAKTCIRKALAEWEPWCQVSVSGKSFTYTVKPEFLSPMYRIRRSVS